MRHGPSCKLLLSRVIPVIEQQKFRSSNHVYVVYHRMTVSSKIQRVSRLRTETRRRRVVPLAVYPQEQRQTLRKHPRLHPGPSEVGVHRRRVRSEPASCAAELSRTAVNDSFTLGFSSRQSEKIAPVTPQSYRDSVKTATGDDSDAPRAINDFSLNERLSNIIDKFAQKEERKMETRRRKLVEQVKTRARAFPLRSLVRSRFWQISRGITRKKFSHDFRKTHLECLPWNSEFCHLQIMATSFDHRFSSLS